MPVDPNSILDPHNPGTGDQSTLPTTPTAAPVPPGGSTVTQPQLKDASVQGQLEGGLLSPDSPLLKQAQFRGNAKANQRGLLNSSMGVQAAENEYWDTVLPIASQNASQIAAENQQRLGIASSEKVAGMNVAAADRQNVAAALASASNSYANLYQSVLNNPNIPADVRTTELKNIKAILDASYALVEQVYQVDPTWPTQAAA
jgi:ribose 5-phosphate isomerase RpiB